MTIDRSTSSRSRARRPRPRRRDLRPHPHRRNRRLPPIRREENSYGARQRERLLLRGPKQGPPCVPDPSGKQTRWNRARVRPRSFRADRRWIRKSRQGLSGNSSGAPPVEGRRQSLNWFSVVQDFFGSTGVPSGSRRTEERDSGKKITIVREKPTLQWLPVLLDDALTFP